MAKAEVLLPTGAIRNTGDYEIDLQVHADLTAKINISIVPE